MHLLKNTVDLDKFCIVKRVKDRAIYHILASNWQKLQ